jgi:3-hydroxyacyl-CoA dehydrogenase/enoyl-CoA hydratase/3-hydroxybutyryl-CoA epimerase
MDLDLFVLDPTQDPVEDTLLRPQPAHAHRTHRTKCFQSEIDADGICWLTFDTPDSAANVWNLDTLDELDCHVEELHRDTDVKALVIRSAKDRVYIAGADLKAVQTLPPEELHELLSLGQDVFTHLESLRIPKIAAIHGACVGGGFEMTLACDWRIASDSDATRIGLPETQLGLIPAWGGCTRLSRLIGLPQAMDLIVRGKLLKPRHAKRLGLVHEVVPVENLEILARRLALQPTTGAKKHHFHFTQIWPVPQLMRLRAKALLHGKFPWTKKHPAAPVKAVEVITRGAAKSFENSLALEQQAIRELTATDMTRRFIGVFLRKEAASKKLPKACVGATPRPVSNVAVIGSGVMGSGIAYTIAGKGTRVLMTDTKPEFLARGVGRIQKLVHDGVKHHAFSRKQARETTDRLTTTYESVPLHRMDVIIEAVVEDMAVKKQLFLELAGRCSEKTLLATNTSALSVTEMATDIPHPERVIGLHFFNPAHLMPLVEIITTKHNTPEVIATAVRFVQSLGKTPILVQDRPGFVVNRILMPYLLGAVQLAETMRDPWALDDAMTEFGMPMGPLRLLDEIGFDVALHVEKTMRDAFGDRIPRSTLLSNMVNAGMLGRKNGQGFYRAFGSKAGDQPNPEVMKLLRPRALSVFPDTDTMAAHLHELMRKEAALVLQEGVAATSGDIELAMMLGSGYPPFQSLFPSTTS